eukprot:m.233757 g.233757  ORF g.233757 m.233757 type:complete len:256 (+) comp12564_c0_seq1:1-768(+)
MASPAHAAVLVAALLLLAGVLFVAVVAPGADPVDAFYFACVSLTSVGYGDLVPTTPTGRLATALFLLPTVALFSAALGVALSPLHDLVGSHWEGALSSFVSLHGGHAAWHSLSVPRRDAIKAVLAISVVLAAGVAIQAADKETATWLDCFYFAVMSVTTVGYGDIAVATPGARIVCALYTLVAPLVYATAMGTLVQLVFVADEGVSDEDIKNAVTKAAGSDDARVVTALTELGILDREDVQRVRAALVASSKKTK